MDKTCCRVCDWCIEPSRLWTKRVCTVQGYEQKEFVKKEERRAQTRDGDSVGLKKQTISKKYMFY